MIFNNRVGLLLFAALLGAAIYLSSVGAQAQLLSTTPAIYVLYLGIASNLAFTLFLQNVHRVQIKFAALSGSVIGAYILAYFALSRPGSLDAVGSLGWYFLYLFGQPLFRWLSIELATRHLSPYLVSPYFSHLATAHELGALLAMAPFAFASGLATPPSLLLGSALVMGAALLLLGVHFLPAANAEIRFSHEPAIARQLPYYASGQTSGPAPVVGHEQTETGFTDFSRSISESRLPRNSPVLVFFALLCLAYGVFRVGEDYLYKSTLKESLGSFASISEVIVRVYVVSSALTVLLGFALAAVIRRTRLSPLVVFGAQFVCLLAYSATLPLHEGLLAAMVGLDVINRVFDRSLFTTAQHILLAAFPERLRNQMRSWGHLANFSVATVLVTGIVFGLRELGSEAERLGLFVLLFGGALGALVFARLFKPRLVAAMYGLVATGDKAATILGVHGLSFLRPRDYGPKMIDLLKYEPKKLLRKTIILSLGYVRSDESVDSLVRQFTTDKEEIQIAVVDALRASHQYKAIKFIVNIVLDRVKTKSLRVRRNATAVIASLYGKKAIPFLLTGLDDEDPRVVANTLEVLSLFREPALIPYFTSLAVSQQPRVRANALMGLARFRRTRSTYRREIKKLLASNDPEMVGSALYILGRLRDRSFGQDLDRVFESDLAGHETVRRSLAYAFLSIDDRRGAELFSGFFHEAPPQGEDAPFMHFFSQLRRERRFELLHFVAHKHRRDPEYLRRLALVLKRSNFDFHEELRYFAALVGDSAGRARSGQLDLGTP